MIDNNPTDKYYYQILVFTGQRNDAGTKSKVMFEKEWIDAEHFSFVCEQVSFVLSGDDDETHLRVFHDPHRSILQRGGIDAFVMSAPKWVFFIVDSLSL